MAIVRYINVSLEKGKVKIPVDRALFVSNHGIEGDAHAGPGARQVSVLSLESIHGMEARFGSALGGGRFGENLVIKGLDPTHVTPGTRLTIDERVVLEVVEIGKECHEGCEIRRVTGDCIMPREGLFCRVITGGEVHTGASVGWEPAPVPC